MTSSATKRVVRRSGAFLGRLAECLLGGERLPVGRVPDAGRRVPVARGQASAIRTPDDSRIEAIVAGTGWGAADGEDHLSAGHVPDKDLHSADSGEALPIGAEGQVLKVEHFRTVQGLPV